MNGAYYKTKESVSEYMEAARGFDGLELIKKLKKYLPSESLLLEIGTGPGTDWKILSQDFKVTGSDNSNEFLRLLRSENPDGQFLELDASSLATNQSFDGIYSNKVLHHLIDKDLSSSLKNQYGLLEPHGVICHSFWKGDGSEVFKGLFVNYHTEEELRSLFKPYFEVLILEEYAEFEESDSLLFIGRKIG